MIVGNTCLQAGDQYEYLFFYKDQSDRTKHAEQVFDAATSKLKGQVVTSKVDVTDPSFSALVNQYGLVRSPMPFVLVIAPNGAITGGFTSTVSEQQLGGAICSKGMCGVLKAMQERRMVCLCIQNDQTAKAQEALKGVKGFKEDARFASGTEIVVVDPRDPHEHSFLSQLGVDPTTSEAITIVMAPPASVVQKYHGGVTKDQIVSDVEKASKGCCGGGCCCPGGCCCSNK